MLFNSKLPLLLYHQDDYSFKELYVLFVTNIDMIFLRSQIYVTSIFIYMAIKYRSSENLLWETIKMMDMRC